MDEYNVAFHWSDYGAIGMAIIKTHGEKQWILRLDKQPSIWEQLDENVMVEKPTVLLPRVEGEAILKALALALDRRGTKSPSVSHLEGQLKQMEYHLEDMRHLLKMPKYLERR